MVLPVDALTGTSATDNSAYTSWTPPSPCAPWHANQIKLWCYDANGNILGAVPIVGQSNQWARNFTYDAENRQVSATINTAASAYTFDGLGQRVTKTSGGVTTVYVYDAFGNMAAEYSSSPGTSPCGTPTCYLSWDHLGSMRMLTDANGDSTVQRYDYLPFGGELLATTNGRTTAMGYFSSPDPTAPKFTGQYRDYETTNDWFLARTFGPGQGRFQSVDPGNAGADPSNPQTWNAYAYVANNPLSYTDPSGMMEFIGAGAEIGSVAGPEGAVVGAVVGAVLDLGALFYGLFGGGGGSPPPPNWANVQQPTASGNNPGEPWSEQNPYLGGGSGGGFNPGGLFGGGNTSPFVLSLTPAQQMTQDVWIARIEGAYFEGLGPIGSFVTKSMFMYAKTRTGGPWDFKNQPTYGAHPELDDYGNCHYGAVGNALGLPNWYTRWAAGAASYGHFVSKGKTPPSSWGRPWSSIGGGDSPKNQVQIRIGQTTGKCAQ